MVMKMSEVIVPEVVNGPRYIRSLMDLVHRNKEDRGSYYNDMVLDLWIFRFRGYELARVTAEEMFHYQLVGDEERHYEQISRGHVYL